MKFIRNYMFRYCFFFKMFPFLIILNFFTKQLNGLIAAFVRLVPYSDYFSFSFNLRTFLKVKTRILAAYILLFSVNLYMDYFESEVLATAWWTYMRITITISHVFISVSAFLIVAAAFER